MVSALIKNDSTTAVRSFVGAVNGGVVFSNAADVDDDDDDDAESTLDLHFFDGCSSGESS